MGGEVEYEGGGAEAPTTPPPRVWRGCRPSAGVAETNVGTRSGRGKVAPTPTSGARKLSESKVRVIRLTRNPPKSSSHMAQVWARLTALGLAVVGYGERPRGKRGSGEGSPRFVKPNRHYTQILAAR